VICTQCTEEYELEDEGPDGFCVFVEDTTTDNSGDDDNSKCPKGQFWCDDCEAVPGSGDFSSGCFDCDFGCDECELSYEYYD